MTTNNMKSLYFYILHMYVYKGHWQLEIALEHRRLPLCWRACDRSCDVTWSKKGPTHSTSNSYLSCSGLSWLHQQLSAGPSPPALWPRSPTRHHECYPASGQEGPSCSGEGLGFASELFHWSWMYVPQARSPESPSLWHFSELWSDSSCQDHVASLQLPQLQTMTEKCTCRWSNLSVLISGYGYRCHVMLAHLGCHLHSALSVRMSVHQDLVWPLQKMEDQLTGLSLLPLILSLLLILILEAGLEASGAE